MTQPPVILSRAAAKNPVNRTPKPLITGSFVAAAPQDDTNTRHSEPRSGEESREQDTKPQSTGSFADAQDDRWVLGFFTHTLPHMPFPGLFHDGPYVGHGRKPGCSSFRSGAKQGGVHAPPCSACQKSPVGTFLTASTAERFESFKTLLRPKNLKIQAFWRRVIVTRVLRFVAACGR